MLQTVRKNDNIEIDRRQILKDSKWRAGYIKALTTDGFFTVTSRNELGKLIPGTKVKMPIMFLRRLKNQPRILFDEQDIEELAESIRLKGDVNKPLDITIRKDNEGLLIGQIFGGERRLRACKKLKLKMVSCLINPSMDDKELFLLSATDNIGKIPLTPIEEALTIFRLKEEFGYSIAYIAKLLSKSPGTVNNYLRYLNLKEEYRQRLLEGKMTKGEALVLASWDKKDQPRIFQIIQDLKQKAGGKNIHPNDLDLSVRRIAENEGMKKSTKKHKGKKPQATALLTIKKILRTIISFNKQMEVLDGLGEREVMSVQEKGIHIVNIIGEIEDTLKKGQKSLDRIQNWA